MVLAPHMYMKQINNVSYTIQFLHYRNSCNYLNSYFMKGREDLKEKNWTMPCWIEFMQVLIPIEVRSFYF